jgi:hypothetical protein
MQGKIVLKQHGPNSIPRRTFENDRINTRSIYKRFQAILVPLILPSFPSLTTETFIIANKRLTFLDKQDIL